MKTLILTLFLLLPFTSQGQPSRLEPARRPCELTIDKVPLIRGLRLGQPYEYLKTVLPRELESDVEDEYGVRQVYIFSQFVKDPSLLKGVHSIHLIYFDDSLVSIKVQYLPETPWQSNPHFVAAIAHQLNLPRTGWVNRDPSRLTCRGFGVLVANARTSPTLLITDITISDALDQRKEEVEAKKRAQFRP